MSKGLLGSFPAGLTTGYQSIGAGSRNSIRGYGWPQSFPAGLTQSYINIGAVQINPNNAWINTFSDSVTATDTIAGLMEVNDTLIDFVTGADTQAGLMEGVGSLTDSVTGADTQAVAAFAAAAAFTDTATGSDSFGGTIAASVMFTDSATATDSFVGGIGYLNTISDGITASDGFVSRSGSTVTFSDIMTGIDAVTGGEEYQDVITDTMTMSDSFAAVASPAPNIVLAGTIDYSNPYCIPNQPLLNLNFAVILGDDNFIRVNTPSLLTGQPLQLTACTVYFYAPETNSNPVVTKVATVSNGFLLFSLSHSDIASLAPGLYPWLAVVTLTDASSHILNEGDTNLTTGVMNLVNRPF